MRSTLKNTLLATGIFAMLGGYAIAQNSTPDTAGKVMVSPMDKTFMIKAEQSNLAEIKTSQLALTKATQQSLKDFAQKMIDDHTRAEDELKQLAVSKAVTLPGDPGPKNKAAYLKLTKLSGAAFDSSYTKIQKIGHDATVTVFQQEVSTGQDADIKAYAQKYLPAIQEHDKMAADMKMGMKSSGKKMSHTSP